MTIEEMFVRYQAEATKTKSAGLKMWSITKKGTTYALIEQNPDKGSAWAKLYSWCILNDDPLEVVQIRRTASLTLERRLRDLGKKPDGFVGVCFCKPDWEQCKVAMYEDYEGNSREQEAYVIVESLLGQPYTRIV